MTPTDTDMGGGGGEPRGAQTNGIGKMTTAHLNLTRSLAEIWRFDAECSAHALAYRRPLASPINDGRVPYAGKEQAQ